MSKLRKEARGRDCMVRIPSVCNFNPETVVLAHIPIKGIHGMGMKCPDLIGAWCCSSCHDVIDGRVKTNHSQSDIKIYKYEGLIRTLNELVKEGKV